MKSLQYILKKTGNSSMVSIVIFLAAVLILFSVLAPNFMTVNNVLNVLRQVSMIGIAACGTITVLLTGGIDLSIGAIVTFINIICAMMMVNAQMDMVVVSVLGVIIATVLGTINGFLISYCKLIPFITTLCMQYVLKGLSYIITNSQPIYGLDERFKVLGQGYFLGIPIPVIIMVVAAIVASIFLSRTYFGRYFYYIGGNEEATKLSGVDTRLVRMSAYVMSGFFTGIASIIWLSRVNSGQPTTGTDFEFDVICGLVLGGVSILGGEGKILGAMIGVMAIGFLNNGMTMLNLNEYPQMVVKGVVLLLAIALSIFRQQRSAKTISL